MAKLKRHTLFNSPRLCLGVHGLEITAFQNQTPFLLTCPCSPPLVPTGPNYRTCIILVVQCNSDLKYHTIQFESSSTTIYWSPASLTEEANKAGCIGASRLKRSPLDPTKKTPSFELWTWRVLFYDFVQRKVRAWGVISIQTL